MLGTPCAKAKMASEEAANLLGNTYATAAKAATDYNLKLIEIAHINTRAAFDYAQELLGAKSPSEFIELSTAHAEIAPEPTGHGLPLSKCEAYNRVYDQHPRSS